MSPSLDRTMEKGLGENFCEFVQDRQAWNASIRDLGSSIGDADSTPAQVYAAASTRNRHQ